jgi:hypothetical protein
MAQTWSPLPLSVVGNPEQSKGGNCMTPEQTHLAEQASKETDSEKLMLLITQLCDALDKERAENRHLRHNCRDDCKENTKPSSAIGSFPEA